MSLLFLIDKDIPNILYLLENNDVIKIVAPTGSGKTLQLPRRLSEKYSVIVVVSNETNAQYLNKVNSFSSSSNSFPIKYVSYFSFISAPFASLTSNTVLILDEIDTNSIDTFILISSWTNDTILRKHKLILTSNVENNLFPNFPTYFVKRYINYPIEIRYTNDTNDVSSSIKETISLVYDMHISNISGDFLIFGLDRESINTIVKKLQEIEMLTIQTEIIPIYSGIKLQEVERIYSNLNFKDTKDIKRKIYVATDLAKTSFTLDNLSCIFDIMRERKQGLTLTGGEKYTVSYISKLDANLRANRGGVTMPCIVYRMISEKTYSLLDEYPTEVINSVPSHYLIIDLLKVNKNNEIYPELEDTYKLMISYGLIDISNKP
jgi:HrpA-like RNA helicase